ncbi:aldose epimerase family protein [uncultured Massilia sp.]|uniref:aldose epimerase family protein n=1 Tax=uncultured Massilia sp. TaxID=169973 RepID=UPI00258A18DC|nr:aldose epimerase family protein [uncultured Massilia sp.]
MRIQTICLKNLTVAAGASCVAALIACGGVQAAPACTVQSRPFGTLTSGDPVLAYTIRNGRLDVTVLDYGGIIHAIKAPDRQGKVRNVVRTLEKLSDYEGNATFSKIIGRFAGRIGNGGFTLDGKRYDLVSRPDGVAVHGGPGGFGSRLWTSSAADCGVDLSLTSHDGENGFPGTLHVKAEFRVVDADLHINYSATTDKPTVVNLTHHAFFNLSNEADVYEHTLQVNADQWLPTDGKRVPTGDIAMVTGDLDLRAGRNVGMAARSGDVVIQANKGLDHSFVLKDRHAARLTDPLSGRTLDVFTSEPGLVVFSANGWNGTLRDDEERPLLKGGGLALETQHYPDSPNIPAFPTTTVRPGVPFRSTTTFRFGTVSVPSASAKMNRSP